MSQNEPIVWTGPHKDYPSSDWLTWRTAVAGHTITVVHGPGSDGFLWSVTHDGKAIPGTPKDHWIRWAQTLPLAQKAARDAIIDYADALAEAGRRIVSTIIPPKPT